MGKHRKITSFAMMSYLPIVTSSDLIRKENRNGCCNFMEKFTLLVV